MELREESGSLWTHDIPDSCRAGGLPAGYWPLGRAVAPPWGQLLLPRVRWLLRWQHGHPVIASFLDGQTALVTFLFFVCFLKKRTRFLLLSQGHFKNTSKGYNQVMKTLNIIKDNTKIFTKIFTKAILKIINLHTEHHAVRKNLNNGTKEEKRVGWGWGDGGGQLSPGGLCGREDSGGCRVGYTRECWRPLARELGKDGHCRPQPGAAAGMTPPTDSWAGAENTEEAETEQMQSAPGTPRDGAKQEGCF